MFFFTITVKVRFVVAYTLFKPDEGSTSSILYGRCSRSAFYPPPADKHRSKKSE
jgi:hypothetical protein